MPVDLAQFAVSTEGRAADERVPGSRVDLSQFADLATRKDVGPLDNLARGFSAGTDQLQGTLYGLASLAGREAGIESLEQFGIQGLERNQAEALRNAPSVASIGEINNAYDFLNWSAGQIGQAAPFMLGTGAAGTLGAIAVRRGVTRAVTSTVRKEAQKRIAGKFGEEAAETFVRRAMLSPATGAALRRATLKGASTGGFAASSAINIGDIDNQLREAGIDSGLTSVGAGTLAGALDALPVVALIDRLFPGIERTVAKNFIKDIAQTAGLNLALEGTTEGAQEAVAIAAQAFHDPNFDFWSPANMARIGEAMAAGAIVGVAMGGVTAAGTYRARNRAEERRQKLARIAARGEREPGFSLRERLSEAKDRAREKLESTRASARISPDPEDDTSVETEDGGRITDPDFEPADNTFIEELTGRVSARVDPIMNRLSTMLEEAEAILDNNLGDRANEEIERLRKLVDQGEEALRARAEPIIAKIRERLRNATTESTEDDILSDLEDQLEALVDESEVVLKSRVETTDQDVDYDDIDMSEVLEELGRVEPEVDVESELDERTGPSGRKFTRETQPEDVSDETADMAPDEVIDPVDAFAVRNRAGEAGGTEQYIFGQNVPISRRSKDGVLQKVDVVSGGQIQTDGQQDKVKPYKRATGSIVKQIKKLAKQFNIPEERFAIKEHDDGGYVIVLNQEGRTENLVEADRVRRAIDAAKLSAKGNPDKTRQVKLNGRTAADVVTLVYAGGDLIGPAATPDQAFAAITARLLELGRISSKDVAAMRVAYEKHFPEKQRKARLDDFAPVFGLKYRESARKLAFALNKRLGIKHVIGVQKLEDGTWAVGITGKAAFKKLKEEEQKATLETIKQLRRENHLDNDKDFVSPDDIETAARVIVERATFNNPQLEISDASGGTIVTRKNLVDTNPDQDDQSAAFLKQETTEERSIRVHAESQTQSPESGDFEVIPAKQVDNTKRLRRLEQSISAVTDSLDRKVRQRNDAAEMGLSSDPDLDRAIEEDAKALDKLEVLYNKEINKDPQYEGGIKYNPRRMTEQRAQESDKSVTRRLGPKTRTGGTSKKLSRKGRDNEDVVKALREIKRLFSSPKTKKTKGEKPSKVRVSMYGVSNKASSIVREVVSKVQKTLGLENEIIVLDQRGLKAWIAASGDPEAEIGAAALLQDPIFAKTLYDPTVAARNIRIQGRSFIYLGPKATKNPSTMLLAVAHELGHQIHMTYWNQLSTSAKRELWKAFTKRDRTKKSELPLPQQFREWMADQAAGWILERQAKPKSEVHRFFWRVGASIRQLWRILTNNPRFKVTESYNQFANNIIRAIKLEGDVSNDPVSHYFANEGVTGLAHFGLPSKDNFDIPIPRIPKKTRNKIEEAVRSRFPQAVASGEKFAKMMADFWQIALASTNGALRQTKVPALVELADIFNRTPGQAKTVQNYHQAKTKQKAILIKRWEEIIEGMPPSDQAKLLKHLRAVDRKSRNPNAKVKIGKNAKKVRKLLDDIHDYLSKANVNVKAVRNYFPRVYDKAKVEAGRTDIVNFLMGKGLSRSHANGIVDAITKPEMNVDESVLPAFNSAKARNKHLQDPFFDQFMDDDIHLVMTQYISSAVNRAEFSRVLGPDRDSKKYRSGTGKLDRLLDQAKQQGATDKQIEFARKVVQANLGQYGRDSIPDGARKVITSMIAYQNMRTLLFTVFASLPDIVGPAVRSGSLGTVFGVYKNEIRAIVRGESDLDMMGRTWGIISDEFNGHVLTEYVDNHYMPTTVRKANEAFFKYTGLEWYTNFTRKAALAVGRQFIIDQAAIIGDKNATKSQKDKARAMLRELGLTPRDVNAWVKGGQRVFGASDYAGRKTKADEKVSNALIQFVDESIMRPNPSQRPLASSHPAFALVYHLKTFMFSFYDTIIRRMGYNIKMADNSQQMAAALAPALAMMALTAAGLELRELIQYKMWGRKGRTDRMDGFEYVWELFQRSGLTGLSQLAIDMEGADQRGQTPLIGIAGPTLSQLGDLLYKPASQSIPKAIPVVSQIPAWRDVTRSVLFPRKKRKKKEEPKKTKKIVGYSARDRNTDEERSRVADEIMRNYRPGMQMRIVDEDRLNRKVPGLAEELRARQKALLRDL